jgi:hypothetical protein
MSTRSNRHVIIEGPDGAGKSTLVKWLSPVLDVPVARRISDSLKGVQGKNLAAYVNEDMKGWSNNASMNPKLHAPLFGRTTPSRLYDRYPLISEPIYGLHVRKGPQPEFLTTWYRETWAHFIEMDPLVIWCLPPYDEVAKHVHPSRDMDGVWRNISQLYTAYRLEAMKFPGRSFVYDYTIHKPGQVLDLCSAHFEI